MDIDRSKPPFFEPRSAKNRTQVRPDANIPSSSPAFATPLLPLKPQRPVILGQQLESRPVTVLQVTLAPNLLRPTAVRLFSRKYNLTLHTSALTALAAFIGKNCGSGWNNDGLADGVLEEVAKTWKTQSSSVIVSDDGSTLSTILKTIESSMSGGRIVTGKALRRQSSFTFGHVALPGSHVSVPQLRHYDSFGDAGLDRDGHPSPAGPDQEDDDSLKHPREWIKVIDAHHQPQMVYNTTKKHFERSKVQPSLFPPSSHKTALFRQRYHLVHQRILANQAFQQHPYFLTGNSSRNSSSQPNSTNKITQIANLLGRNNSTHLLLGLLTILPTGALALADLTGVIQLDMQHTRPFPDSASAWFCPGMVLLIDGLYQENSSGASESSLGAMGGIGATIGGKFLASILAHPPCQRRTATLGIQTESDSLTGPAFGWTDFLGLGSDKATGARMRNIQSRTIGPGAPYQGNNKIVIASEINLDQPSILIAIRSLFSHYASRPVSEIPICIVLVGNFLSLPALTSVQGADSINYKQGFNNLASVIADFPSILACTTIVFVPGDHDAWSSAFSAGSATPIPRKPVPDLFTSHIRRAVAEANREIHGRLKSGKQGEAIWASNPARLTWFGCVGEMVLFRDDITGRLRRSALRFPKQPEDATRDTRTSEQDNGAVHIDANINSTSPSTSPGAIPMDHETLEARRLVKTICDQAHLSPFPLTTRPVHWDYANILHLYPLPTALVLADPQAPHFALNYMGTCVMNPSRLIEPGGTGHRAMPARWIEFDVGLGRAEVRETS